MRNQLILISFLGALLGAGTLHAQTPPPAMKGRDCSQAADPKACEERRSKMREAHKKAEESCAGKEGTDHSSCMREQMCAQDKDLAQCEAHRRVMGGGRRRMQ